MVIGGGIAGISASIDIGNAGYEVVLVEKLPSVGGTHASALRDLPNPRLRPVHVNAQDRGDRSASPDQASHLFGSGSTSKARPGDFTVRVRRKAGYVDWEKCTGCGLCQQKCPSKNPSEFDRGMGMGKAIYTLSPQAVPNKPVINPAHCRYFKEKKCRVCEKICPVGAIDYEQKDRFVEERVGAIVTAVGFDLLPMETIWRIWLWRDSGCDRWACL